MGGPFAIIKPIAVFLNESKQGLIENLKEASKHFRALANLKLMKIGLKIGLFTYFGFRFCQFFKAKLFPRIREWNRQRLLDNMVHKITLNKEERLMM